MMTRVRKALLGIGIAILVLIAAFFAALAWVLYTPSGLRFALDRAVASMHGQLAYASASGTLAGETTIAGLRWRDAGGDSLQVERLAVELQPWALLGRTAHIRKARIEGVTLDLAPARATESPGGFSLQALKPPLKIVLDNTRITDIDVRRAGKSVFRADSLAIAGSWSANRLKLDTLDLRAPDGHVTLAGTLALGRGYRGSGRASIDWTRAGTHYAGTIDSQSNGTDVRLHAAFSAPAAIRIDADVALAGQHDWTLALAVPSFDARQWPALPASLKTLAINLHGAGDSHGGTLQGELVANGHAVLVDPARLRYDGKTLTLDPLRLRSPNMPGVATATGTVQLAATPISASLDVAWQGVRLPADLVRQPLDTHGKLHLAGNPAQFALTGALALGPPGRLSDIKVDLSGTPAAITLHSLRLVQKGGGLDAAGTVSFKPMISWKIDATATRFDPGAIVAGWSGALGFKLATQGSMTTRGPQATLQLADVTGNLRGRSLAGSRADIRITPTNLFQGTLLLVTGNSRIHAVGKAGNRTDATVTLDLASLGDWLPDATGGIGGQFTLRGNWPRLAVAGTLHGHGIEQDGRRIASLQLKLSVPDLHQPGGNLDLALAGVHANGLDFTSVHLTGSGNAASHHLHLTAQGKPLSASLDVRGSWQKVSRKWTGTLGAVELSLQGMPAWRQQQPSAITWQRGAVALSPFCLATGAAHLCVSGNRSANGTIALHYDLKDVPLEMLAKAAAPASPLQASGTLDGSGQLTRTADGALEGTAHLSTGAGSITYVSHPGQPLLAWSGIDASFDARGTRQHLQVRGALGDGGHLNGDVTVSGAGHALAGDVDVDLRSLGFLSTLSPEIANVKGSLAGRLTLAGTLAAPRFEGSIRTHGFAAELPRAGLKLHDGEFAVTGDPEGRLAITGQITSGQGVLHVQGSAGLAAGAPLSLRVTGENVLVADIPAAHVVASPDLGIARADGVFRVTGSITIPSARISVNELPGQGPTAASPDVVIVDEPEKEKAAPLAMQANIEVKFGNDVRITGYGFDGKVHGQLAVNVQPGKSATGRGDILVSGKYQAYGQDLTIENGRVLFAGTRLDNPGLDLRAVRRIRSQEEIEVITVGLHITGTAQHPIVTVFSDPAMQQSDALSYLVTGRPLDELKGGEGNALQSAAQTLGGLAGNLIAKSVGSHLGIEAGVANSEALGTAAFTAGKYLSPRLFISYGVGLFTPGQVITLRYTLNRFLQFEAENATTGNRASLNYRIEK